MQIYGHQNTLHTYLYSYIHNKKKLEINYQSKIENINIVFGLFK